MVGLITTYATSAYHNSRCELDSRSDDVYSILHYVIKIVSDLRQVGGFLRFSPPVKLISWRSVLLVEETRIPGKNPTDLTQVTDKLYHIMLYTSP